jgi:(E)-4-hydroxy-3-methylbut-2-enyl-diphosphate synthase
VGLIDIVNELDGRIRASGSKKRVKVAVMGCEVNGPGEAKEADVGIAFGKGYGMLFKKGKTIKRVAEKDAVKILLKNISTI